MKFFDVFFACSETGFFALNSSENCWTKLFVGRDLVSYGPIDAYSFCFTSTYIGRLPIQKINRDEIWQFFF